MTHYDIKYDSGDRAADDAKAIADIRDYLSTKQWACLMALVGQATPAELAEAGTPNYPPDIKAIRFAFMVSGVSGYPVGAFCRKYALAQYRTWLASGDDPIQTDEQGFPQQELVVQG